LVENLGGEGGEKCEDILPLQEARADVDALGVESDAQGIVLLHEPLEAVAGRGPLVHEHRVPVYGADHAVHLGGRVSRGVEAAHDGAHARPDDHVDGNASSLDLLEDAYVGQAEGRAAREHDGDLRPRCGGRYGRHRRGGRRRGSRGDCRRGGLGSQDPGPERQSESDRGDRSGAHDDSPYREMVPGSVLKPFEYFNGPPRFGE
jgi:hypothetical protein